MHEHNSLSMYGQYQDEATTESDNFSNARTHTGSV